MNQLVRIIESIVVAVGVAVRLALLGLVLLVAFDVLLRYLLDYSPVALQELEWHLMSPIALLGLSYAVKYRADVRVDFIYEHFSVRGKAVIDLLSALLMLAVGIIICWLSIGYVEQSYAMGEGSPDPGGLPYRYLLKAFLPLGFALLALQAIAECLRATNQLIDPARSMS
ncbi:TRAP transporter small permease subunit [Phytohalomonas tamaricis]|uniref:TRAP transporter small permease subunit n=1 Tax=Phytohalomonas tamaricis TaxID=2081032 RepID=UPI000D0B7F26|nr:TRAP transporter small permease subunit [Phytohalomonas tamaricis]